MVRTVKAARTKKILASGRVRRRPTASKTAKLVATSTSAKTRQMSAAKPVTAPRKPPELLVPKLSKNDLRLQMEKLERTVATLRTRGREAARAAKQAAARIEELETQLATLERQAAKSLAPASQAATRKPELAADAPPDPKPTRSRRDQRLSAERDPGDAVPPGVAVEDPKPMDKEAATALKNL